MYMASSVMIKVISVILTTILVLNEGQYIHVQLNNNVTK